MSIELDLRQEIVDAYRALNDMGLMIQGEGNVSCRVEGGMLISCSGATADNLTVERVVKVSEDGSVEGSLRPSSEWRMHLAAYNQNPMSNAVVHTHSDYCVALACNQEALPGFHYMVGTFGGEDVPCVPYSTFGSEQLAVDAGNALSDRAACLLGNHGMICHAHDLPEAVGHAQRLEALCRQYWLARQLGTPALLSEEQWRDFFVKAREGGYIKAACSGD